ncbi:MAG: hypothetical protein L0Z73_20050 [Gammaproteobacteria bacterium]|nr:hypothetical protein [Gammaproteobacteria bacterium]
MMNIGNHWWKKMWIAAAAFNFMIAVPLIFATAWTYDLAYGIARHSADAMALRLWRDFGIFVLLIGAGYYLVALDISKNRGLALLGVFAKLFDVVTLSYRYSIGIAESVVLIPAAIDGAFMLLFIVFLGKTKNTTHLA